MAKFTVRENEIVDLLLEGKSNKQMALVLHVSKSTIEYHLKNIYRKLEVNSRTEAILKLSKNDLGKSTGSQDRKNLGQTIGEKSQHTVYSSQAKQFFDPKEEIAMKNRTLISISLSIIALAIAIGMFAYLRFETKNNISATTGSTATPINTPRGVLQVPSDASTRSSDEILLILQAPRPDFHYAAVFVTEGCIVPIGDVCSFTGPIPFSGEEGITSSVYWMPDGENGFYMSGNQILVLSHVERVNGKSGVLVPEILKPHYQLNVSPDGRWLIEDIEVEDPYASELVLIKTSTGRMDKLNIGLEKCFKIPLGWLTPTKFMFRCEISTGATSKKNLSEVRYYTYNISDAELLEVASGMDIGYDSLSPNGRYIIYFKTQNGSHIKDLSNQQVYPSLIPGRQAVWAHDSSKFAVFTDNGDIYISKFDGSDQRLIYSSGESGYLSMEWFPDNQHIALAGYFNGDDEHTQMIVLSENGEIIHYDQIPTTDGYNIIGISPLPAIQK